MTQDELPICGKLTEAMIAAGCAALAENLRTTSDVDAKLVREIYTAMEAASPHAAVIERLVDALEDLLALAERLAMSKVVIASDEPLRNARDLLSEIRL